jgi:hypothetical protein
MGNVNQIQNFQTSQNPNSLFISSQKIYPNELWTVTHNSEFVIRKENELISLLCISNENMKEIKICNELHSKNFRIILYSHEDSMLILYSWNDSKIFILDVFKDEETLNTHLNLEINSENVEQIFKIKTNLYIVKYAQIFIFNLLNQKMEKKFEMNNYFLSSNLLVSSNFAYNPYSTFWMDFHDGNEMKNLIDLGINRKFIDISRDGRMFLAYEGAKNVGSIFQMSNFRIITSESLNNPMKVFKGLGIVQKIHFSFNSEMILFLSITNGDYFIYIYSLEEMKIISSLELGMRSNGIGNDYLGSCGIDFYNINDIIVISNNQISGSYLHSIHHLKFPSKFQKNEFINFEDVDFYFQ